MPDRLDEAGIDPKPGPGNSGSAAGRREKRKSIVGVGAAFAGLLAVWIILSIVVRPWAPTPFATIAAMYKALGSAEFYADLWLTLGRVLLAFVAAMIVGFVLGIAVGLSRRAEAFFQPLIAMGLAVPDPVYVIFAILALGVGEPASLVALTIALSPFVSNIVRSSVQARDASLDEMVQVYRFPRRNAFWDNLVPQLIPALLTAARFSFALSWKIVIVVEALGQPEGLGAAIFQSFRLLRMRDMLALAILFTLLMGFIERVALGRLERRVLRWRALV